jgi:hypothetical protein
MSDNPFIPPDESSRRRIRELYATLTLLDEANSTEQPHVSFRELVAFLCGNYALPEAQQDLLFADPELLADFRTLVNDVTVKRQGRDRVVLEMRAAASDGVELRNWIFRGGSMRMRRFGPDEELLTIRLDNTLHEAPTALLLQCVDLHRVALLEFARAEPSFATGINIVLDERRPDDKQIVEILQNPSCEGFLVNTAAGASS